MELEEYRKMAADYEARTHAEHDRRAAWFREARFGLFIHYGLFASYGMGEWAQLEENQKIVEYEELKKNFCPKEGCADEWCRLAKEAGANYAVLTTRHHEGFCLWDSKVNPFNSMNVCGRDIVREFVDACRRYGLRIGLYSSLMEWRHPDSWRCMYDDEARARYTKYIEDLNVELCSNYGKIDILWYDMPYPHMNTRNWDSVRRNDKLRALQPDMLINNRSRIAEDFYTPEESLNLPPNEMKDVAEGADWEACLTFNGFSWGYVDEEQVVPYCYSANQVVRILQKCTHGGGNLLINIGPRADGSVPVDSAEPLRRVGAWLRENGEAVYGLHYRKYEGELGANQVSSCTASVDKKTVYVWNYIWPHSGKMMFGGYKKAPRRITLLSTGEEIKFHADGHRLILEDLPEKSPDKTIGIAVLKMEFDEPFQYLHGSYYPQFGVNYGADQSGIDVSEGLGNPS